MSDKYNAAEGAYKIICHELYKLNIYKDNIKENLREDLINKIDKAPSIFKGLRDGGSIRLFENIGIGTGSTADQFTEHFLPKLKKYFKNIYSSSKKTTEKLESLGFNVANAGKEHKCDMPLDFYVDGADEVDKNKNLIKGGGGAHRNEKILAKKALMFICIVDTSKVVNELGKFPLPVEVYKSFKYYDHELLTVYGKVTPRNEESDRGNPLYDLHDTNISDDPHITEIQICNTKKVWDVGLFTAASKKPDIVVIGNSRGFSLL